MCPGQKRGQGVPNLPDDVVQDRVHQAAYEGDAPGRLVPYGAEQRQLLEDAESIVVPQLLGQLWRQILRVRAQQEGQGGAPGWERSSLRTSRAWTQVRVWMVPSWPPLP